MFETIKYLMKSKKGDLEIDEIGKVILGLILLIVLIVIVTVVIKGELFSQGDKMRDAFSFFK